MFISFQHKNKKKKGKYPDGVQIFSIDLFDVKDFKETWQMIIWLENAVKENLFLVRGIALGKSFWVVYYGGLELQ